ncbi:MAG: hypothetical protein AUK34_06635 [Ignavibacteria bacterium CG2_30_36_16]|nr:MAG: hypothetical protein AUK34_06635 [Ignavibacteria bacterium CG2_30_36_16]
MKRNFKSIFPNRFRIKNPETLEIRQIQVQTFVDEGGLVPKGCIRRKFYQLFGAEYQTLLEELNKELAA